MTRHMGHARNKAMQERREIREQGAEAPAGRLFGRCSHCGHVHPWPDQVDIICPGCGVFSCLGEHGCACGGGEG